MVSSGMPPVQAHLTTHPFATGLMEERPALAARMPGDPHPLVDAAALRAQLEALASGAKERLFVERAKAKN